MHVFEKILNPGEDMGFPYPTLRKQVCLLLLLLAINRTVHVAFGLV